MSTQRMRELWHDESTHPSSTAMRTAMETVGANSTLVKEWREHCEENYDGGWISYAQFLEVSLEITLDHLSGTTTNDALETLAQARRYLLELREGTAPDAKLLQPVRSELKREPVPLKVDVSIPGRFYAKVHVHEESINHLEWRFEPHGSNAGYAGASALVDDVRDIDGGVIPEGEAAYTCDFLNVEDTAGPFWQTVQEHLSNTDNGKITVNWEE